MKKLFFVAALCAASTCAMAQIKLVQELKTRFYAIPSMASTSGSNRIYGYENGDDGTMTFYIYDEHFALQKQFTTKAIDAPRTVYRERKGRDGIVKRYGDTDNYYVNYGTAITVEQARDYLTNRGETIKKEVSGTAADNVSYVDFVVSYYEEETYGQKYPEKVYTWRSSNMGDIDFTRNGWYEGTIYDGEWVDRVRYDDDVVARMDYTNYDADSGEEVRSYLSQTLFNDDDKLEYVLPLYKPLGNPETREYDNDYDGETDQIATTYKYEVVGMSIYSETGDLIQTINFDGAYESREYNSSLNAIRINGRNYFIIEGDWKSDDGKALIFEKSTSSSRIQKVSLGSGINVSPRNLHRSDNITVELGEKAKYGCEVQVVNASGQTVARVPVRPGERQVTFSACGLSKGVNVVNIVGGDGKESSKIVVK